MTSWKANLNAKETLSSSLQARKPVIKAIHDPERSLHAPTVSERELRSNSVTTGFNAEVARVDQYQESAETTAPSETADHIARKRVAENLTRNEPAKKRRKTRTVEQHAMIVGKESARGGIVKDLTFHAVALGINNL